MSHEHDEKGNCMNPKETKWAVIFLKEEDGAKEQMDKMLASMERDILHGTDEENADVLAALSVLAQLSQAGGGQVPDAVNRLGSMAANREMKRHNREILALLEEKKGEEPEVVAAIKGLLKALKLDSESEEEPELDAESVTAEVEALFAKLRGDDVG